MPNRFYIRRFLNRPGHHAGGYLLASVEDTSRSKDGDPAWVEFELADCSRRVALDFPLYSAPQRRNSVRKARLLLSALEQFVEALEAEAALADARPRKRKARR